MTRTYPKSAGTYVEKEMHEFKRGKLKSGSGKKVASRKQAIAIGLSKARRSAVSRTSRSGAKKQGNKNGKE